ncbi:hypothetical protein [Thalassoroseus pseudoceratinae]|uniref:hypothetical protein n=1 Tax=Thalassoroseus pseudoceratinae TaxID=2713176 RepID=UPI0014214A6C|nr:hypothetical protein [Thalassoroseus pseudoceratinae]
MVTSELILDGRPLLEHCERSAKQTFDVVSPIGWTSPDYQTAFVERLLLRQPAVLPSGRREVLVCPECADLGCGCISADVSSDGEYFVWNEIGYENNYAPEMLSIFPMGRFVIPKAELLHQLRGCIPDLQ